MVRCMWLDAKLIGEHVHVEVFTGRQYGQDKMPDGRNTANASEYRNDAGQAGELILREEQWPPFIRALAMGGAETGLRIIWRLDVDGRRLWNGLSCDPCFIGEQEPQPWERA